MTKRQKDLETETQIKLLQMAEIIEEQNKEIRFLRYCYNLLMKPRFMIIKLEIKYIWE